MAYIPYVLLEPEEQRIRVIELYQPGYERVTVFSLDTSHGNTISQLAYLRALGTGYQGYPVAQGNADGPYSLQGGKKRLTERAQQFAVERCLELLRPRGIRYHGSGMFYVDVPTDTDEQAEVIYQFLQQRNVNYAVNWNFRVFGKTHQAWAYIHWFPAEGLEVLYERMDVAVKLLLNLDRVEEEGCFRQVLVETCMREGAPPQRCQAGYRAIGTLEGLEYGIAVGWGVISHEGNAEEDQEYRLLRDCLSDEHADCHLDGKPRRYLEQGIASHREARDCLAGYCGVSF